MYIYLITNLVNDKKYVGLTIQEPSLRWSSHKNKSNNTPKYHLHHAMNKYGIDNFKFEVIDECKNLNELKESEKYWISEYNTFNGDGYNMTSGGEGSKHTPKSIEKIRQANLGRKHTEETKHKIRLIQLGHTMSDDNKKALSKRNVGNNYSLGRKLTEEHKKKLSINNKGKNGIQCKNSVKVVQIDKVNGDEMVCWFSIRVVSDFLNIDRSCIIKCCKGNQKTSGGFGWRYLDA